MANVFQKIAGGFKRVLPGAKQGATYGGYVGKPVLGAAIGAASTFLGANGQKLPGAQSTPSADNPVATGGNTQMGPAPRKIDFGPNNTGGGNPSPTITQPMQQQMNEPQGNDQFDSFNLLLQDALKRSQGINTDELLKRRRALQRAAIGRSSELSQEDYEMFDYGQQNALMESNLKALQPDIDENAYQIKKAESITANFEKVFTEARKFGEEFAEKVEAPENVINAYKSLIEADPSNLATVLSGVNEKTRMKVISSLDPSAFKAAAAKKASGSGNKFSFTSVPTNELLNNGFSFNEVTSMEQDITGGATINELLTKYGGTTQKDASIRKAFGGASLPASDLIAKTFVDYFNETNESGQANDGGIFRRGKANAKKQARALVESGQVDLGDGIIYLTPEQIQEILLEIDNY